MVRQHNHNFKKFSLLLQLSNKDAAQPVQLTKVQKSCEKFDMEESSTKIEVIKQN